jgi:hypothetical protein
MHIRPAESASENMLRRQQRPVQIIRSVVVESNAGRGMRFEVKSIIF